MSLTQAGVDADDESAEGQHTWIIQHSAKELEECCLPHKIAIQIDREIVPCNADSDDPLNIYYLSPPNEEYSGSGPIVVYVHGGSVRPQMGIGYYPKTIYTATRAVNPHSFHFVTFDHRGSDSHENNSRYNLNTRITDVQVAIDQAISRYNMSWNGNIHLIGVSMGGYVAARAALRRTDISALTLVVPALYTEDALDTNFGPEFKRQISGTYSKSTLPIELQQFINEHPELYFTFITKRDDQVVSDAISNCLIGPTRYLFDNRQGKGLASSRYVHFIDEGNHHTSSVEELNLLSIITARL